MNSPESTSPGTDWRELIAVILLSITTILTAWSGFQSSKWGGAMSVSFSQASSARIAAARSDGDANRRVTVQVGLFTQWLQAATTDDKTLMDLLVTRFPEPLASTFPIWLATDPLTNPEAPSSPFVMPEYQVPELADAAAYDATADAKFAEALDDNARGDNYTLLTVAFASVLFFSAISGRMRSRRSQWALLGVGMVVFAICRALPALVPEGLLTPPAQVLHDYPAGRMLACDVGDRRPADPAARPPGVERLHRLAPRLRLVRPLGRGPYRERDAVPAVRVQAGLGVSQ